MVKSINQHLDQLSKALDNPAVKTTADDAKGSFHTSADDKTGQSVATWARNLLSGRAIASEMERLNVNDGLPAGTKIRYTSQNYGTEATEHYGVVRDSNPHSMTATVEQYELSDDDYNHKKTGTVHHIAWSNIRETYGEEWPSADVRTVAFTRFAESWLNGNTR